VTIRFPPERLVDGAQTTLVADDEDSDSPALRRYA
jgi:hypothetical protein